MEDLNQTIETPQNVMQHGIPDQTQSQNQIQQPQSDQFQQDVHLLIQSCQQALQDYEHSQNRNLFQSEWSSQVLLQILSFQNLKQVQKIEKISQILKEFVTNSKQQTNLTETQQRNVHLQHDSDHTSQLSEILVSLILKISNQRQLNYQELEEINILGKVQQEMQSKFVEEFLEKHQSLMKQFGGNVEANSKTYQQQLAQQIEISKQLFSNSLLDKKEQNVLQRLEIKNLFVLKLKEQLKQIQLNFDKFECEDLHDRVLNSLEEKYDVQWPTRQDLKRMQLEQLQNFKITKLGYFDHKKRHDENWQWRSSFRFEDNFGNMSPIFGYDQWQADPQGQEKNVNYVDLQTVSKIVVVSSCGHEYSTCAVLFYSETDLQSVIAAKAWGFNEENMLSYLNNEGAFKHKTYHIAKDKNLVGFRFNQRSDSGLQHYFDFEPIFWSVYDFLEQ